MYSCYYYLYQYLDFGFSGSSISIIQIPVCGLWFPVSRFLVLGLPVTQLIPIDINYRLHCTIDLISAIDNSQTITHRKMSLSISIEWPKLITVNNSCLQDYCKLLIVKKIDNNHLNYILFKDGLFCYVKIIPGTTQGVPLRHATFYFFYNNFICVYNWKNKKVQDYIFSFCPSPRSTEVLHLFL